MASSLFQRWFGARPTPPRPLADALAEVETLASARPALQASCKVLGAILLELFTEPGTAATVTLAAETAREKLAGGVPLLRNLDLPIDERSFQRRWLAVGAALDQPDAVALADLVRKRTVDPLALLGEVLAGRPDAVAIQAESHGIDASLLASVLRLTAFPALAQVAGCLEPLRQGVPWNHGSCPLCGSWPLLGETRGLEQLRYLRCGLCAAAWEFGRFRCPFCPNQDHHTLGYLHAEGEEDRYRAGTCDACRGYVKWLSSMSAFSSLQLLVMDLATLHLDLVAAERGFMVPSA